MSSIARKVFRRLGYEPSQDGKLPPDLTDEQVSVYRAVAEFTMTSVERVAAVVSAARYISENGIAPDGAIVECGVWRGGSMMAAALVLKSLGDTSRKLYLYDTFEGMTDPTEFDLQYDGVAAEALKAKVEEDGEKWCGADEADVKRNIESTGYPPENILIVKGRVEDTVPATSPEKIALLRLDTDWYESTKHELVHLYPRLGKHGVLIIDDYGHWSGSRKATDEYFAGLVGIKPLLNRADYAARVIVKPE